ncbi:hypothetical protein J3A83DRAFT_4243038 [Scleroderma citrinum]
MLPPPPPPPGMLVDGQYPSLPTSATRLHQATWPHPHPPWADGSQPPHPHMIPMGYPPPHPGAATYYPSPYYRTNMIPPPHPDLVPHPAPHSHPSQPPKSTGSSDDGNSSSSRTGSPADADSAGVVPVIDPSLDMTAGGSKGDGTAPIPLEIAVGAVLNSVSAERESSAGATSGHVAGSGDDGEAKTADLTRGDLSSASDASNSNAPYSSPGSTLERPPEMEHMLTEDGEPMLNPAELLTQESLASPPPS